MPTPIQILTDPISLVVLGIYAALMLWEAAAPARELPKVRGWKLRGMIAFTGFFFLSTYLPLLWGGQLARFQLFDLTGLGKWGGALVGLLVYEFGAWLYHRSLHASDFLWKTFHQMHHSAERLDTYGAFWFSPLDMIGWTALASVSLTVVVGVTAEAATLVLYVTTFLAVFQHANIRTPKWLGYIVQRPESHSVHHGRGIHNGNFSDLPLFDVIFGTIENPADFAPETGFYDGASSRVGAMLAFRDVSVRPDATGDAVEGAAESDLERASAA
ncbi:MAG: sterol desaturase family protein [Thermoanaerobaculia bacterium]